MRLAGTFRYDAPPETAYALFTDPDALTNAMIGLRSLQELEPDRWAAEMKVGLGNFAVRYRGTISVTERTPEGYRLLIAAETDGGSAEADVRLRFVPQDGGTRVEYDAKFAFAGAQRLIPALARGLVDFFMHGMKDYLEKSGRRRGPGGLAGR